LLKKEPPCPPKNREEKTIQTSPFEPVKRKGWKEEVPKGSIQSTSIWESDQAQKYEKRLKCGNKVPEKHKRAERGAKPFARRKKGKKTALGSIAPSTNGAIKLY